MKMKKKTITKKKTKKKKEKKTKKKKKKKKKNSGCLNSSHLKRMVFREYKMRLPYSTIILAESWNLFLQFQTKTNKTIYFF